MQEYRGNRIKNKNIKFPLQWLVAAKGGWGRVTLPISGKLGVPPPPWRSQGRRWKEQAPSIPLISIFKNIFKKKFAFQKISRIKNLVTLLPTPKHILTWCWHINEHFSCIKFQGIDYPPPPPGPTRKLKCLHMQ